MTFDLAQIRAELGTLAVESPLSRALAIAVVNDCMRTATRVPPGSAAWDMLLAGKCAPDGTPTGPREQQVAMFAQMLIVSPLLRASTTAAMETALEHEITLSAAGASQRLEELFQKIMPLTAEMMRANAFRQDEALRRWIEAWGGVIEGETAEVSAVRLEQLDYRKTLVEYDKASKARTEEAGRRAEALKKAQEAEAAARGWRE